MPTNSKENDMTQITEGTAAPDFSLPADNGGTVTLSELKGKMSKDDAEQMREADQKKRDAASYG